MSYSCPPCGRIFTGIIPYTDHINSEKHKKKINNSANPVNVPEISSKMSLKDLDPYIKQYGNAYKCLLCNIILNSLQQAQTHGMGKSHNKLLRNNPLQYNEKISSVPSVAQLKDELAYTFTFHNIKIENAYVIADVKVFDIDEPVVF